jgi:hypothetical protein
MEMKAQTTWRMCLSVPKGDTKTSMWRCFWFGVGACGDSKPSMATECLLLVLSVEQITKGCYVGLCFLREVLGPKVR